MSIFDTITPHPEILNLIFIRQNSMEAFGLADVLVTFFSVSLHIHCDSFDTFIKFSYSLFNMMCSLSKAIASIFAPIYHNDKNEEKLRIIVRLANQFL